MGLPGEATPRILAPFPKVESTLKSPTGEQRKVVRPVVLARLDRFRGAISEPGRVRQDWGFGNFGPALIS
jgi:hypothetical protein